MSNPLAEEFSTIKRHEGGDNLDGIARGRHGSFVCYQDSLGKLTGGHGHLLSKAERKKYPEGTRIPAYIVDVWWENDSTHHLDSAEAFISVHRLNGIDIEAKKILVNMVFNMGAWKLSRFKNMIKALQKKDYYRAADEMIDSRWFKQTGIRSKELVARMRNLVKL